jgi:AmmeMemoRadiSam system protein B
MVFNSMARKAVVAGHFYEGKKEHLLEEIRQCFLKGPGAIPKINQKKGTIKGVVVPHAGYYYSGHVAAYVFNEIAKDGFPKKVILLGPNHQSIGSQVSIMTHGSWTTPLGDVHISPDAKHYCTGVLTADDVAHKYEHSIEVQLPFLQFLSDDFSFIPICFGWQEWDTVEEVGRILSRADDTLFIASTDFSHVGFSGFPSEEHINTMVRDKDQLAIDKILHRDPQGLIETVREYDITMCGYGAVAAMLAAIQEKTTEAKLLKYATSYDVEPSTYCVGYAAIIIK